MPHQNSRKTWHRVFSGGNPVRALHCSAYQNAAIGIYLQRHCPFAPYVRTTGDARASRDADPTRPPTAQSAAPNHARLPWDVTRALDERCHNKCIESRLLTSLRSCPLNGTEAPSKTQFFIRLAFFALVVLEKILVIGWGVLGPLRTRVTLSPRSPFCRSGPCASVLMLCP